MPPPAGRMFNGVRLATQTNRAAWHTRSIAPDTNASLAPAFARIKPDNYRTLTDHAADFVALRPGRSSGTRTSSSSKSAPCRTSSALRKSNAARPSDDALSAEAETGLDSSTRPEWAPVKLKSTSWMEMVDAEAEDFSDWDGPMAFEEDGPDVDQQDTGEEQASVDKGPAAEGQLTYFIPGAGTIQFRHVGVWMIPLPKNGASPVPRIRTYSAIRETCRCTRCVHPSTRQKTGTMGEMRAGMRKAGWFSDDSRALHSRIRPAPDRHAVQIKWDDAWHRMDLKALWVDTQPFSRTTTIVEFGNQRVTWPDVPSLYQGLSETSKQSATLGARSFKTDYREVISGDAADLGTLREILVQLHRFGFAIIGGVPTQLTGNKDCTLRKVAEAIGPIRNTFYGETWDVKSVRDSKNVAYTDLNLGLHMDLLYHSEPPRFQLLHCLRNRVHGGESYFVDSFAAAEAMMRDHPTAAKCLKRESLVFEYDNDGHYMERAHHILPERLNRVRSAVNWSPPFQGVRRRSSDLGSRLADEEFQNAVELWETYLAQDARRLEFKMEEGDLVLFDNRRVLHARRAFRNWTEEEKRQLGLEDQDPHEPQRWLKGCYLDGDTVWDKLVTLTSKRQAKGGP